MATRRRRVRRWTRAQTQTSADGCARACAARAARARAARVLRACCVRAACARGSCACGVLSAGLRSHASVCHRFVVAFLRSMATSRRSTWRRSRATTRA
jgi:hypothetical protein